MVEGSNISDGDERPLWSDSEGSVCGLLREVKKGTIPQTNPFPGNRPSICAPQYEVCDPERSYNLRSSSPAVMKRSGLPSGAASY
jgi:hypothetical protein